MHLTAAPVDRSFFQEASECSVEAWLAFLGHRWNALILYHLSLEPSRFGRLRLQLPSATPKVLTERLADLIRVGLVERQARGEEYRLTPLGERLMPLLNGIELWSRGLPDPRQR